jgi:hypothetical protein
MIWSTLRRSLRYLGSPTEIASPLTSGDTRPCRVRWLIGAAGVPSFGPGWPSWLGRGAAAGSRRVPWADERHVQGRRGQICSATRSRKPAIPTGGLARLARTILHFEISNTALGPPWASQQLRPGNFLVDRQLIMYLSIVKEGSYTVHDPRISSASQRSRRSWGSPGNESTNSFRVKQISRNQRQ